MLVSKKELKSLKLRLVRSDDLKELARVLGINTKGTVSDIIKKLIEVPQNKIDDLIKKKYQEKVEERQKLISDEELKQELQKVKEYRWGKVIIV